MTISLEQISKIVEKVREKDYVLVKPSDRFEEDLGIDSLGLLMVIINVATDCKIDGTEEMVVDLVYEFKTVGDVIKYVESYNSK